MQYAGVDIGKEACHATILNQAGDLVEQFELVNNPKGWAQLEKQLGPGDELAVEASTHAYPIHDHFRQRGFKVHVAHPRAVKQITQSESKTDRKDSHHLAHLLRVGYLPKAWIPDPDLLRRRDVLRARIETGRTATRLKNRIHAHLARNGLQPPVKTSELFKGVGRTWLERAHWKDERDELLQIRIHELDSIRERQKALDIVLARSGSVDDEAKLLMSIKGIDFYLAQIITTELGRIERFPTYEAFQAYAGCAPTVRESAGINRGGAPVRNRSGTLKWALGMVVERVIGYDNPIRAYYQIQLKRTRRVKRAKARARRKVAALVYALLKTRQPCRWSDPQNVEDKLTRMKRLSRKEIELRPPVSS
jgi:transposase